MNENKFLIINTTDDCGGNGETVGICTTKDRMELKGQIVIGSLDSSRKWKGKIKPLTPKQQEIVLKELIILADLPQFKR